MIFISPLAVVTILGQLAASVATPVFSIDTVQKPLILADTSSTYSLREQNDTICDAGSRQWTGWIDVGEEKKLFFWFFESRDKPSEDPVMVWLNGGPGGSSLLGLFEEIGPCQVIDGQNGTVTNEHSWTNFANVLFLDQPAGVGFSSVRNGTIGGPDNLAEASRDFDKFMAIFFTEVLPQFAHLPFHITGESFGGTYVPGYVSHIIKRQQLGVPGVFQTKVESITLVDAVIDILKSGSLGMYDHMCNFGKDGRNKVKLGYNETVCRSIEKVVPECERLDQLCISTYDKEICASAYFYCADNIDEFLDSGPIPRIPYDDRRVCKGDPPFCGIFGKFSDHLNDPKTQAALGLHGWNYSPVNMEFNSRWEASKEMFMPTTREMTYILDESPTKVLVLNGNNDIVVNTEGQKRMYDDLPWTHQAKYRLEKFADWSWPNKSGSLTKGGEFKIVDKLAFVTLDEAGHTSPGDQKEAASFILKCWLSGGKGDGCPFEVASTAVTGTTQESEIDMKPIRKPGKARFW